MLIKSFLKNNRLRKRRKKIQAALKAAGVSQSDLCRKLNLSRGHVSNIIAGKDNNLTVLREIEKITGLKLISIC
jgi:transcriptional regulator with XRE-family HTH domain